MYSIQTNFKTMVMSGKATHNNFFHYVEIVINENIDDIEEEDDQNGEQLDDSLAKDNVDDADSDNDGGDSDDDDNDYDGKLPQLRWDLYLYN